MHARWRTRVATFCALACSVFWAGNVDAEETGNTQANVETIKNQTYAIMQDVDVLRAQVETMVEDVAVLSQLEYWFGTVRTAIDSLDTYLRSGVDLRPSTLNVFRDYFNSVESSLTSIRGQLQGIGTVTNFLGQTDYEQAVQDFWQVFADTFTDGSGCIYVMPYSEDYMDMGYYLEGGNSILGPHGTWYAGATVGTLLQADSLYTYEILQLLKSSGVGSSNGVQTATTNLLTTQNLTLERVAEYVAGVSNAVGTISDTYETEPTGSNDLPSEEKPKDLAVEKSVDTSSMEDAVQQTFDGLEGLTPSGSSTVPEIMIRDAYRGEDAIKVRLDLSEIGIATRVCKACWAILLAVGVLGVVRSEWDYWTTLGGSAT